MKCLTWCLAHTKLSVLAQSESAFIFWPLTFLKYLLYEIFVKNINAASPITLFFCLLILLSVGGLFLLSLTSWDNPQVHVEMPATHHSQLVLHLARGSGSMKEFHTFSWWPLIPFRLQCHSGNCPRRVCFQAFRAAAAHLAHIGFSAGKKLTPPPGFAELFI